MPRDLADELGGPVPDGVADLPAESRERLADLLHAARRQQAAALQEAVEEGLGFLPRVLRGTVTRMVLR